jgi:hypothetical protein
MSSIDTVRATALWRGCEHACGTPGRPREVVVGHGGRRTDRALCGVIAHAARSALPGREGSASARALGG